MKKMIAGVRIEAHARTYEEPCVTLHKIGSNERVWLTPEEARKVAALLIDAATEAECKWNRSSSSPSPSEAHAGKVSP